MSHEERECVDGGGVGEGDVGAALEAKIADLEAKLAAKPATPPDGAAANAVAHIAGSLKEGASASIKASTTLGAAAELEKTADLVAEMGRIDGTVIMDVGGKRTVTVTRRSLAPSGGRIDGEIRLVGGRVDVGGCIDVSGTVNNAGTITHTGKVAHSGTVVQTGTVKHEGTVLSKGTITVNGVTKTVTVRERYDACGQLLSRQIVE